MYGGISRLSIQLLVIAALAAAVPSVQGQQVPDANPAAGNPEPPAIGQVVAMDNQPGDNGPESGAPQPPVSTDELARRVAELEGRLARAAEVEQAAKKQAKSKPTVVPSGRIQFDMANFSQDAASIDQFKNDKNAVGFRRARIALLGEAFDVTNYIIEVDFAHQGVDWEFDKKDQNVGFKDVYMQVRELPLVGNVRVGHFKECFGLEQILSDNYTTFMERSINDEGLFVPGRNNGIMAFNWTENERATWAIGAFTNHTGFDQPPRFQIDHWGLDMAMRGTFLPWYDEASGGRGLLHTGAGYVYRSAPDHWQPFGARPEAAFAHNVVDLDFFDVSNTQVANVEAALVYGPLSLQSELFAMSVNRLDGVTNNFYGCYAYASYFLTGEHRPYNRKMGTFDRVRPFENFFRVRTGDGDVQTGWGAWEVAYRFSYIDMLDSLTATANVDGRAAIAADHTLGVNWYLNPYARIMFNYIHSLTTTSKFDGSVNPPTRLSGGNTDIFETRFAIDF